ncbi:Oidioi.mRNA.OKI2018_I69.chr1.g591.t1.cds [Oikopleura dioica]|uniref:Oidioi.mRNA.OKI2018_I69.chr1.g591.t1.cds n=1 Tax=Oikopleura dioica TaxID=34765 RepID=A0ABN7SQC3_OIKDI|nr:Oidioi.mRNA.OKI2018_I69.chr1.g591.t1.cds [Oikopleura dioica]
MIVFSDEDLFDECSGLCRLNYQQCLVNCDSSVCQNECANSFSGCVSYCPCGVNCIDGCSKCEHPLCLSSSPSSTTTDSPIDQSNVHILVIPQIHAAYIVSGDGSKTSKAKIDAPDSDFYTDQAPSAVIRNELYIFGGDRGDKYKIAKFVTCEFVELSIKMNYKYTYVSSALSIEKGERETWSSTGGWEALPDYPRAVYGHTLTSLGNSAMILAGGYVDDESEGITNEIRMLKDGSWSILGNLKRAHLVGSSLRKGQFIYLASGENENSKEAHSRAVERIQISNDELIETVVIGGHDVNGRIPVLYETSPDSCAENNF